MSRAASAPEPPSVVVRHHPGAPAAVLREVLAGAEEEGVPVEAWPDPTTVGGPPGDAGAVALAFRAAQRSRLDVGVGVDEGGTVVVHHAKLPAERPARTDPAPDPAQHGPGGPGEPPHGRRSGAAAARIVTGLPLPAPAGERP
ncbi:glycerol dehydratase reactivase beta/small subunit family protein [Pseudonocardia sp. ICBG1293]|uniref:glycerol dehydratase reactivase beta/small subunit family protein n=1 Tax=Pseudonocardia sp. ICBG1293 TaxID=2844382 RepID=UPI001CCC0B60|nr:glycerol dehydratase reactivase beta/small subunit family protein [Pseudonocardia sp. ICBG1293]